MGKGRRRKRLSTHPNNLTDIYIRFGVGKEKFVWGHDTSGKSYRSATCESVNASNIYLNFLIYVLDKGRTNLLGAASLHLTWLGRPGLPGYWNFTRISVTRIGVPQTQRQAFHEIIIN